MSLFLMPKLRLVVLDCAFEQWNNPEIRDFFGRVLALRFSGYGHEYPSKVVPTDTSDFFGTLLVTCEETENGSLIPLSAYKMISANRCHEFRKPFPAVQIPLEAGALAHARAVQAILERCRRENKDLGYSCSWTIAPQVRKNEELTRVIRDLVYCSHLSWQRHYNVPEMVIAGVTRFKTDRFQESVGYRRLAEGGEILGSFGHTDLWGEPVVMLHLETPSDHCLRMTERLQDFWDRRIVMASPARIGVVDEPQPMAA